MATNEQVEKLRQIASESTATSIDSLVINAKWGEIDFNEAKDNLQIVFDLFEHVKSLPINLIPTSQLTPILNNASQLLETINRLKGFNLNIQNFHAERTNIIKDLNTRQENFYVSIQNWIAYLAYQQGDIQKNIRDLNRAGEDAQNILDKTKENIKKQKEEIEKIIIAAREAAGTVGVAHFTTAFSDESDNLDKSSIKWLKATGWSAGLTIGAALLSLFYKPTTNVELIYSTTTKLIILGLFFTATVWCGKIYKATKHMASINKHRANSLKTFQAFIKASSDDSTRDAVLMETTKSIFSIVPTGYIDGGDNKSLDGSLKVIEIIKNAIPK